jgi:hypothetical protein
LARKQLVIDVMRDPLRAGCGFRPLNDNGREYISGAFLLFLNPRPFVDRNKAAHWRQGVPQSVTLASSRVSGRA